MSVLNCPLPLWSNGRISVCIQHDYLSILIPLSTCLVSLLLLLLHYFYHLRNAPETDGFEPLLSVDVGSGISTAELPRYVSTHGPRLTLLEGSALLADIAPCLSLVFYGS